MTVNIVAIHRRSADPPHVGSGILLDSRHVLTAAHVIEGHDPIFVSMVPGRGYGVSASIVSRHAIYDAAVLRLDEAQAANLTPPKLMHAWTNLCQVPVQMLAITPTHAALQTVDNYSVGSYDTTYGEYELTPQLARGNSGGVLVHNGTVVALLCLRIDNEPLARAVAMHNLLPWITGLISGTPSQSDAQDVSLEPVNANLDSLPDNDRGQPGLSHQLGTVHLHVDGAQVKEIVNELVKRHRRENYASEVAEVLRSVAGPQRRELNKIFDLHNPGTAGKDALDYFSTTQILPGPHEPNRDECSLIAEVANAVLTELDSRAGDAVGVVVELERVVGLVDDKGNAEVTPVLSLRGPSGSIKDLDQFLFVPFNNPMVQIDPESAYEYHFSLDVDRAARPIELEYLAKLSLAAGFKVGGWFMFKDKERWAYRSNSFEASVSEELLRQRWWQFKEQLQNDPNPALRTARLRLLAEEPLALWKTPLRAEEADQLTIDKLATWEGSLPPDVDTFWVLLPNFLGDTYPRVTAAMWHNLRHGMHYIYFLRSSADAKRWLDFRECMAAENAGAAELMKAYIVDFADASFWEHNAAFIAHAYGKPYAGYRLKISRRSNQVAAGVKLSPAKLKGIVAKLAPSVGSETLRQWRLVMPQGPLIEITAVCVNFSRRPSEDEFRKIDSEIARRASLKKGEVALYGHKSITIVFVEKNIDYQLDHAFAFAQETLEWWFALLGKDAHKDEGSNMLRVGLAVGDAHRVPRACGMLWTGTPIRECREMLYEAPQEQRVFLSPVAEARRQEMKLKPAQPVVN